MTETRIRWEDNGYGGFLGHAGNVKDWVFQVWRPGLSDWQLDSALPGKIIRLIGRTIKGGGTNA